MGMNYIMRHPKDQDPTVNGKIREEMPFLYLVRGYSAFASGPEAIGDNCEFYQIEKLYHIDLSPLRFYNYGGTGMYEENVDGDLDWKLYNAESEEEKEELKKIYAIKLEEARRKSKDEYENKWIATSLVKSTILNLIEKLQKQPELLDEIEYSNFFDKRSFNMFDDSDNHSYKCVFEKNLEFIDIIEKHGMYKMAFYESM